MSRGDLADHPYCYPGTDVLRNREGIRDRDELEELERQHSADRMMTLPHDLPITVAGYCEIHRYVFQDVYDWAGEYRTVDTGRTGPFCKAKYIAEHISELNAIHCFLEGNGRTQRAFLEILARQAGHEVDLACIDPNAWNAAAAKSFHTLDYRPMQYVIAAALVRGP
jgi:cell filamentation protein